MILALCCLAAAADPAPPAVPSTVTVDASRVLNAHADEVGVWVNTLPGPGATDIDLPRLAEALRGLNVKSVRYGWGGGAFDPADLSSLARSPDDPGIDSYADDGAGRLREAFGPAGVADLLDRTGAAGFAVLTTGALNYTGTADAALAGAGKDERLDRLAGTAAAWAAWGKTHGFTHYEIGNENDLTGRDGGLIPAWDPADYARLARRYLAAVKAADPAAKVGVNGGMKDAESDRAWFAGIAAADPRLADDLDFLVTHKYEFWLDAETFTAHPEYEYGRLGETFRAAREEFFPTLPVFVTETGPYLRGADEQHYRALLGLEMLGNLFRDAAVHGVQLWPTWWGDEGLIRSTDYSLTGHGLAAAAYARFARPVMCGHGLAGSVRFFAARGPDAGGGEGVTLWLVNRAREPADLRCEVAGAGAVEGPALWRLTSPTGTPEAADTRLAPGDAPAVTVTAGAAAFDLTLPPLSAAVVVLPAG